MVETAVGLTLVGLPILMPTTTTTIPGIATTATTTTTTHLGGCLALVSAEDKG